ncbi:MAG: hypothetical protein K2X93_27700 [Candidatus Obscuribacterales bacterium]|nr:hypothetical protein [Candidatus Obscuribacterales bacterium]
MSRLVAMSGPVKNVNSSIKSLTSDMKGLKETVTFTTTAIFVAVLGIGLLIVVGTPIAGFVVWRNRVSIMKLVGGDSRDVRKLQREGSKLTS